MTSIALSDIFLSADLALSSTGAGKENPHSHWPDERADHTWLDPDCQKFTGRKLPSTAEVKNTFGGILRKELVEAQDSLAIETGIQKFIEWIRSGKLEVKLYREQNIHAKIYIMTLEKTRRFA